MRGPRIVFRAKPAPSTKSAHANERARRRGASVDAGANFDGTGRVAMVVIDDLLHGHHDAAMPESGGPMVLFDSALVRIWARQHLAGSEREPAPDPDVTPHLHV